MSQAAAVAFSPSIAETQIRVTEAARAKLAELMQSADEEVRAIRIFVSGGGCSGLTYGMTFTDQETPHDALLEAEGMRLVVDAVALSYLEGCEIDFTQKGMNASFVFNNVFQSVGGSGVCGGCGGGGCGAH